MVWVVEILSAFRKGVPTPEGARTRRGGGLRKRGDGSPLRRRPREGATSGNEDVIRLARAQGNEGIDARSDPWA